MKLRLLAASVAATLALSSGAVLAQSAPAKPAAKPATAAPAPSAAPAASDKATLGYALGYDMARDLAERNVDLDLSALNRGVADGYAKRKPTMDPDKLQAAMVAFQKRMTDETRAAVDRASRENKTRSDAFMSANKAKPGVSVLPSGVQYKVIDTGTGAKPTAGSTVSVSYRGSITTGEEFANTYSENKAQPAEVKLSDFPIAGVREALMMMPVGSRWEVYVPADKAFGESLRPIGPSQAVIFDIKLVGIK